ncbi:hypothetical protein ACOMHN_045946 [Nucella lapillus]
MAALQKLFEQTYEPSDQCKVVKQYVLGKILGQGRSSLVRRAVDTKSGKTVAIKTMTKTAGQKGKKKEKQFRQETEILLRVRHAHIVAIIEVVETPHHLYAVMEMVSGCTLRSVLKNRKIFSEEESRNLIHQLCSALRHLHGMDIVHRDVKPDNVMVSGANRTSVKLIDLGLSSRLSGGFSGGQCGSPLYMAPELLRAQEHGPPVDMWSLGVVLHELMTGHVPFRPERGSRHVWKALRAVYAQIIRTICQDVCHGVSLSSDGADFLRKLLLMDDKQRLTSQEALGHPWMITR